MAVFTDNFTRADNTSLGAEWTETDGDSSIVGNALRVQLRSTNPVRVTTTTTAHAAITDQGVSVTHVNNPASTDVAVIARATGVSTYYAANVAGTALGIYRYTGDPASGTLIGSAGTVTRGTNKVIRLEVTGSGATVTLRAYYDGVLEVDTVDTHASRITGAGQAGVLNWDISSTIDVDSFFVDDLNYDLQQEGFRFRNDDGNETTATWKAAQDTNVTAPLDTNLRLRMLVNVAASDPPSGAYQMEWREVGGSYWTPVAVGAAPGVSTDIPIILGTDDAQQLVTTMALTGTTLGASLDATNEYVGMRFQSVQIPPNATILTAVVALVPSGSAEDEPLVTMYCEAADNSATFTTGASNISGRAATTSPTSWSSANLGVSGTTYVPSVDIASHVQQVVNRAGWTMGNALSVIIVGSATSTRDLTIESFENTGLNPPRLLVTWNYPAPAIVLGASANITASGVDATTAQLTAPAGKTTADFDPGWMQDDQNPTDALNITDSDYTELEWCLKADSAVAANTDVYEFRVTFDAVAFDTYTLYPTWTIGAGGGGAFTITADAGSVTLSGTAAALKAARKIAALTTAFNINGTIATLALMRKVAAASGTFNLTGTAASLLAARKITAVNGAFSLTGTNAALQRDLIFHADPGAYLITGTAATLGKGFVMPAAIGAFSLSGTAAALLAARIFHVDSGAYLLTGTAATLALMRRLSAVNGAFALTGTNASLLAARKLASASGTFNLNGTAATLALMRRLSATSGAFLITGTDADLLFEGIAGSYTLNASSGAVALTGTDANLLAAYRLPGAPGAVLVTGTDATFLRTLIFLLGVGAVQITGTAARAILNTPNFPTGSGAGGAFPMILND